MYHECTVTANVSIRRRALFVSYWTPPRNGVGSIRSAHLLKHLPAFGWDVTAITARFPQGEGEDDPHVARYIQTGYWDLKGLLKHVVGIGSRSTHEALGITAASYGSKRTLRQRLIYAAAAPVTFPDEQVGWLPFATAAVFKTLGSQRFDAVLSSAPPFTTHLVAALSHRNIPWIADLRDLWAENDSVEHSKLYALLDGALEHFCLSRAAALIASSTLSAARFQCRYPRTPCFSVSTGFDAEEWERIPFGAEPQCTLLYAGTLYLGKRDPTNLFAAIRAALDEGLVDTAEIRLDFYTPREPWLFELIRKFGLEDIVRVHGLIERETVLAAERRANRLVVLSWDGKTAEGVVAGKLFEYFGARRPILAIGGPETSGVEDLLHETGAGVRARSVEEVKAEVLQAVGEHRNGQQRIISPEAVHAYTADDCARRFAGILDQMVCDALERRNRRSKAAAANPANTAK